MTNLRWLFALVLALLAAPAQAQVPSQLPIQGSLFDDDGFPVDGEIPMTFVVYGGEALDAVLHQETLDVSVEDGFFTVYLGADSPLDIAAFAQETHAYLGISVDGGPEGTPIRLASVPYAVTAQDAQTLDGQPASHYAEAGNIAWNDIQDPVPTIGGLSCSDGQVAQLVDGTWTCVDDGLAGVSCAAGYIPVSSGGGDWSCGSDADTIPGAYTGLRLVELSQSPLCQVLDDPDVQCPGTNYAVDYSALDEHYLTSPIAGDDIQDATITDNKIATNAVGSRILRPDAVANDAFIADGAIKSQDLNPSLGDDLMRVSRIYRNHDVNYDIGAGTAWAVVHAECDGTEDIPLTSGCYATSGSNIIVDDVMLSMHRLDRALDASHKAKVACGFNNLGTDAGLDIHAEVYCIDVPTP